MSVNRAARQYKRADPLPTGGRRRRSGDELAIHTPAKVVDLPAHVLADAAGTVRRNAADDDEAQRFLDILGLLEQPEQEQEQETPTEDPRLPATDDPRCGSTAGYQGHRKRHEQICKSCRRAKTEYDQARPHGRAP